MIQTHVLVNFTAEVFHNWPDAPEQRAYLRARHRHLLYVTVSLQVWHADREVEIHDLRDICLNLFPPGDRGACSCETMAKDLIEQLQQRFGLYRALTVDVLEDGEAGARVVYTPVQGEPSD